VSKTFANLMGSCTRYYTDFKINKKNIMTHQMTQANTKMCHVMMCTQASLYTDNYYQYIVGFKTAAFAHGSTFSTRKHTESEECYFCPQDLLYVYMGNYSCFHIYK